MKKTLFVLLILGATIGGSWQTTAQIVINTIAGNGTAAYSGDLGPATAAEINNPYGVAADTFGNVYFTDYANNRIRKIDTDGIVTTIAGTGVSGFSGDGGAATAAKLRAPRGIAVDAAGNVYFTDYANNRLRKINTAGIISTIAGTGFATYGGDGGPASAAALNYAWGVAVDSSGNIFIADQTNCRVRKINTSGIISTIAGNGICFGGGDGGPASAALVQYPVGVACDRLGNVYIADYGNNRVRKIDAAGIITTIAGSPTYGFSGDGGPSTAAKLYYPMGIAASANGEVYICDVNNSRLRKINTAGIINTIAGTGVDGYSGDGGTPTLAKINRPTGVAVDALGKVYLSDNDNNRIRRIQIPTHAPYFTHGRVQDSLMCPIESINLDTLLAVFDVDTGQTETWSQVMAPAHGVLAAAYSTLSTGSSFHPVGLSYAATAGYIGNDSFSVRIFDGAFADTTTFHITILPSPFAGTITGADSLCPGDTLTFVDTVTGGTWGTGSSAIAAVSSTGLVTGVSPGSTVITYSVTNSCGTVTTSFPVIIKSTCPVGVGSVMMESKNKLTLFPNPGNGALRISLSSPVQEEAHFVITNIVGEQVASFRSLTNRETALALNVPQGIYFVTARTASSTTAAKLIIGK